MSRNENLIKVEQKESLSGFTNLFLMEVSELWKSRTWIWLTLLWVGIIDGITALTVIGVSEPEPNLGIAMFTLFACFFPAIAIIIILQESIVGEKRSGTAEWILSKPISRESFVLSKFFAKSININISMVLIPGIIAYFELSLIQGQWLSFINFLGALGLISLVQMFHITFTLMLGTIYDTPAPVAAIPMVFNFSQQFIASIPFAIQIIPLGLFFPQGTQLSVIASIIIGEIPFSLIPLFATVAYVLLFLLVAILKFKKVEL